MLFADPCANAFGNALLEEPCANAFGNVLLLLFADPCANAFGNVLCVCWVRDSCNMAVDAEACCRLMCILLAAELLLLCMFPIL